MPGLKRRDRTPKVLESSPGEGLTFQRAAGWPRRPTGRPLPPSPVRQGIVVIKSTNPLQERRDENEQDRGENDRWCYRVCRRRSRGGPGARPCDTGGNGGTAATSAHDSDDNTDDNATTGNDAITDDNNADKSLLIARRAGAGAASPQQRSSVPGCLLGELHARGEAEFGVDVGEMGLHGAR